VPVGTVNRNSSDIFINLNNIATFKQVKEELENKLRLLVDYQYGAKVNIDLGGKSLNSKQVREIEDILLDYGLHWNKTPWTSPDDLTTADEQFVIPGGEYISHYDDTALLFRNLRSGQKFFSDGNIVVLGDINPGAELIAGGSVLVMGALRGMAQAGAFGDENTVIAAYRLNPTQLRIANHITRPPDGEVIIVNSPEMARIRAGKVVIEKLKI
jgi:septum site-determining protein MinC